MDPLKMYFLLKLGIFHCYVSLPEGIRLLLPPSYLHLPGTKHSPSRAAEACERWHVPHISRVHCFLADEKWYAKTATVEHPGSDERPEPTNHPFRKENDRNQTSMIMFHVNLQGCILFPCFMAYEHTSVQNWDSIPPLYRTTRTLVTNQVTNFLLSFFGQVGRNLATAIGWCWRYQNADLYKYLYLEPVCPLFLKVNPSKQGLFQPKQGSFGFQVIIIMYM